MKKNFCILLIIAFLNLWISPYFELNRREEFIKHNTFSQISENNNKNLSIPVATAVVAGRGIVSAFSLAELIITMSIIGVVAVLVIPPMVTNIQDMQFKAAFKEAYSILSQATSQLVNDNSGNLKNLQCASWANDCLMGKYIPYLNVNKSCNTGFSKGNCWTEHYYTFNGVLDGWDTPLNDDRATIVLSNGVSVRISMNIDNCSIVAIGSPGTPQCGWFAVDVNGLAKPNIMGRDIFFIHITETGLSPYGNGIDNVDWCLRTLYADGSTCAEKVLRNKVY